MKVDFASNKLRKQMGSASEIKRAFGVNAKRVKQRLDEMEASPNLAVLQQIPAANCHPLKGDRQGEWAVDVSGNHRIVFEPDHDSVPKKENGEIETIKITDIKILKTTDYH
jgi:plasmid maintenance system killer protein